MCGICGIVNASRRPPEETILRRMAATMAHRGPDDEGVVVRAGGGLGFRRLSIIDVDGSHQPIANEDRSLWLVCNGEIYNFVELRARLREKGHRFSSQGDAEVVLHAYEEWGDDCLDHLRGMFGLALWDARRDRLLLARDRLGIKPLFYAEHGGSLVFGSELKSVRASGLVPDDIDHAALDLYLSLMYIPAPATAFSRIRKLPAGHRLVYEAGRSRIDAYWRAPPERPAENVHAAAEALRAKLSESVRLHLQSDVPLAFFLSGGMDSSLTVALAAEAVSGPLTTFSVGFETRSHDERRYAAQVARRFGCDHHELRVRADAASALPAIVAAFDEPFGDSSAVPTHDICRAAAGEVKVVVGGDGGDELFAGYEWTRRQRFVDAWNRLPSALRRLAEAGLAGNEDRPSRAGKLARFLADARCPPREGYARRVACFTPALKRAVYAGRMTDLADANAAARVMDPYFDERDGDPAVAMNRADLGVYLPDDDLCKVDRMTMAHSLEGRVPILDHVVAEFALGLPMSMKLRGFTSKYVLKLATADLLPAAIRRQRKQGFAIPVARWMRDDLYADASRLLTNSTAAARGLWRPAGVQTLLEEHRSGRADHGHRLYCLLVLELWLRLCVDGGPATDARGLRLSDL